MSDNELSRKLRENNDQQVRHDTELSALSSWRSDQGLEERTDTEQLLRKFADELVDKMVARARKQRRQRSLGEWVVRRFKTPLLLRPLENLDSNEILTPLLHSYQEPEGARVVSYGWRLGTHLHDESSERMIERFSATGKSLRELAVYRTAHSDDDPSQGVFEKWYDIFPWAGTGFVVKSYPPADDRQAEIMRQSQAEDPDTYLPENPVTFIEGKAYITGTVGIPGNHDPMQYVPTAGQDAIDNCYELVLNALGTLRF